MIDLVSFVRSALFAVLYAGIEYRYVNRREAAWTKEVPGFAEKPAFWHMSPYQAYLLLPLFVIVAVAPSVSAWAGNVFLVALLEDVGYFVWRGSSVRKGEWTTRLFGSFSLGGEIVPVWWPLALVIVLAFYVTPL